MTYLVLIQLYPLLPMWHIYYVIITWVRYQKSCHFLDILWLWIHLVTGFCDNFVIIKVPFCGHVGCFDTSLTKPFGTSFKWWHVFFLNDICSSRRSDRLSTLDYHYGMPTGGQFRARLNGSDFPIGKYTDHLCSLTMSMQSLTGHIQRLLEDLRGTLGSNLCGRKILANTAATLPATILGRLVSTIWSTKTVGSTQLLLNLLRCILGHETYFRKCTNIWYPGMLICPAGIRMPLWLHKTLPTLCI
jgi:hypothetical protein